MVNRIVTNIKYALLPLSIISSQALAASDNLAFSWFGNLGAIVTDSAQLGYRNDISRSEGVLDGSIDFSHNSKLGAQIDYQVSERLDLVGQVVYRGQKDVDLDSLTNLAFLRFKATNNFDIRLGRTALDLFMLTEYRDVDFAYPWAKTPSEVYGLLPARYVDGIDLIYATDIDMMTFRGKVTFGNSSTQVEALGQTGTIDLEDFKSISLELSAMNWLAAVKWSSNSLGKFSEMLTPLADGIATLNGIWTNADSFANELKLESARADYLSIGGKYEFDNLTLFGELAYIKGNSSLIRKLNNGYFSLVYNQEAFEHFVTYAFTDSDSFKSNIYNELTIPIEFLPPQAQVGIQMVDESLNSTMNFFASNQQTLSFGTRWNWSENIVFKLQLDSSEVDDRGFTLWSLETKTPTSSNSSRINTFFINMSFAY